MLVALTAAALAGLATGVGALPHFVADVTKGRAYAGLLGTGAGLMLSAATLGLLGHALEPPLSPGRVALVAVGLLLGAALMVLAERLVPHHHAAGHPQHAHAEHADPAGAHRHVPHVRRGILLSGAMTLHRIPEGFAVGAAFAAKGTEGLGLLLAVAVGFQNLCEGLVTATPLRAAGMRPLTVLGLVLLTGLPVPLAAAAGYLFSAPIESAMPLVLALAAGALITLTSNEIIPETHGHGNEVAATVGIVTGFVITIVLRAAFGH